MKKLKFCLLFALLFTAMLLALMLSAAAEDTVYSGTWGDLAWELNKTTGALTISGEGAMDDFSWSSTDAWRAYTGSIQSVTIGEGVTSIGDYAFEGCSALTSITIPDSVTSIGNSAFQGCTGLTSVTIGNSVTIIGSSAFYGCTGLTSITIPDSVTSIGGGAFRNCSGLTSITIPKGVTSIGDSAFRSCNNLTSVTIGRGVTSIGEYAFSSCNSLTSITVQAGNRTYYSTGNCLIENATKTLIVGCQNSIIPTDGSVIFIGQRAFFGCTDLTGITIPNNITAIEQYAFSGCTGLTSITIPDSVTSIGGSAFESCTNLTSITIPDSVTSIGENAFESCTSLTTITIPNNVTSIGGNAFKHCTSLTSITIGSSVTSIGYSAFSYCRSLSEINFNATAMPNLPGINPVFSNSGENTIGITVNIGANVTRIPANLFYLSSSNIVSINFAENSQCNSIGYRAFDKCTRLKKVTINDIAAWCGISFYDYATNPLRYAERLYLGTNEISDLIIPEGVTSINKYAFYGCDSLTSITIPDSVTSIGDNAFLGCDNLTSVTIGSNVTSIGVSAFQNCSSLTSVTIGNSVTSIGVSAFQNCSSLTSVTIGNSVTSISNFAFENCTSINIVYINAPALLNHFGDFTNLGYLLLHCDTVAICTNSIVPDLISTTFPFTEDISYLDTKYTAYSVHEHAWEDGTTYIQCVKDGFRGETCSLCSLANGENLVAHTFGDWQKHNATQHKRVCACTEVEYDDHNWNNGEITTPATHTKLGVKTFTCSDCGETKTEDVAKLTAHEYGDWQKHNATQHKHICTCTEVEYANHSWNSGEITTPATHTTLGVKTYTCTICGETKTEDVAKLTAHEYGAWQKHNATQHKRVCACTEVEYDDHNWNSGEITTPATHTALGVKTFTCSDCGETKTEDVAKLTAHEYGEWVTIEEAQIGKAGKKEKTCTCGQKVEETIPALKESSAGQANTSNGGNTPGTEEESLGTGAVIGIVGGSVAVVGGGGFCLYWFVIRKKKLL